ncbi:MAG: DNA polymerase II small subunit [Candidatus Woesearchaeota archaeon]|jgi:DNA polymerase II small subunit
MQITEQQDIIQQLYKERILVTSDILALIKEGKTYDEIVSQVKASPDYVAPIIQPEPIQSTRGPSAVKVIETYKEAHREIKIHDFTSHFAVRLQKLTAILRQRSELENITSIARVKQKTDQEKVSIIGFVSDIAETKNGHMMLTIEDKSGEMRCLAIKRDDNEAFEEAKNLSYDEVIGITGTNTEGDDKIIFIDQILHPDVPNIIEFKKSPAEGRAAFISDLHFGAKVFLQKEWDDFILFINGKSPDPALNKVANEIQYLFIVGDMIEGAGIYPNQDQDVTHIDVREQYKIAAKEIAKIPSDIHIIICPGNHDTMRLSEPQPPLYKEYAPDLLALPNVINVSSPSVVNIHSLDNFPGFNVLMYHGYSFFYYMNNIEYIRKAGGIERVDLVMEYLLKRRHLSPAHTSNLYIPDPDRDELIIKDIPDFFVSGHLHKFVAKNFKSTTLLNCSCFVGVTDYQKKQGMVPDVAKVAVVNLRTRDVQVVDFSE